MTQLGIEEAVETLKKEHPDAVSFEIRGQEMENGRKKGVIVMNVNTYDEKRAIYEKYGEGEALYPALFEGWEVLPLKFPRHVRKSKKVDGDISKDD